MRIKDTAELTGTTIRTIRYYHQIGLVPVPSGPGSRRYELEHVARILRVRWLAEAGLSLDAIADVLADESRSDDATGSALHDLRATAATLEVRIAALQSQLSRVTELIELAEQGRELTALPPGVTRLYDRLAEVTSDPAALDVYRRERQLAEMFAQRGLVPPEFDELIDDFDDADLATIADYYTRFGALTRLQGAEADAEIAALSADLLTWMDTRRNLLVGFNQVLPAWVRATHLEILIQLAVMGFSHRNQKRLLRELTPVFVRVLKEGLDQ